MIPRRAVFILALLAALPHCGDTVVEQPLAARGEALSRDPSVTRSQYNLFACASCHPVDPVPAGGRVFPGAPLRGAARRTEFWGGETHHLEESVARCWTYFMRGDPTALDGPEGRALHAWLEALAPEGSSLGVGTVRTTWTPVVRDLGAGTDMARGLRVWARACGSCHGMFGTGAGRVGASVSVMPADTLREHCNDPLDGSVTDRPAYIRAVVAEKTRHGSFLGYAGNMPPFSVETLSDEDLREVAGMFRCP